MIQSFRLSWLSDRLMLKPSIQTFSDESPSFISCSTLWLMVDFLVSIGKDIFHFSLTLCTYSSQRKSAVVTFHHCYSKYSFSLQIYISSKVWLLVLSVTNSHYQTWKNKNISVDFWINCSNVVLIWLECWDSSPCILMGNHVLYIH